MKTYEEKTRDVFCRIKEEKEKKREQRKTAVKIAAPVLSFCIAAALGFGIWQSGILRQKTEVKEITDTDSKDISVIWADDNHASDEGFREWNGCDVSFNLYDALESENKDSVFAIYTMPSIDQTFKHEGKTLEDHENAMWKEKNLPGLLEALLKEGDSLKYGEALYTTGTPSGERWSKALYEERIESYEDGILEKYIVDGEFLREDVERDIKTAEKCTQATDEYNKALAAYFEQLAGSIKAVLASEIRVLPEKRNIIMFLTKDEFSAFIGNSDDDVDTADWIFGLAARCDAGIDCIAKDCIAVDE